MNYFELFELPISLKVDKSQLAKKYFELQKKCHPDFFTQADEEGQATALEKSSSINKALKLLQNQDETIKYVLELKGLLAADEKYQLPPDFLMEMMDLNENLSADSATAINEIEAGLYDEVKDIIEHYNDSTSPESLQKVKAYYFKKKYVQRILERLDG